MSSKTTYTLAICILRPILNLHSNQLHSNGCANVQKLYTDSTLIAYPKDTVLPQFLEVGGRRCNSCAPKPFKCHIAVRVMDTHICTLKCSGVNLVRSLGGS